MAPGGKSNSTALQVDSIFCIPKGGPNLGLGIIESQKGCSERLAAFPFVTMPVRVKDKKLN